MVEIKIIQEGVDIDTGLPIKFPWIDGIEFPKAIKEAIPVAIQYLSNDMEDYACFAMGKALLGIGGFAEAGHKFVFALTDLINREYLGEVYSNYNYFAGTTTQKLMSGQVFLSGWYRNHERNEKFEAIYREANLFDNQEASNQLNSVFRQCRIAWLTYMLHHATFTE